MQEIYNKQNGEIEDIKITYYFNKLEVFTTHFELKPKFREVREEIISESIEGLISIVHYVENQQVSHVIGRELSIICNNVSLMKFGSSKDGNTLNFEVYSEKDKEE